MPLSSYIATQPFGEVGPTLKPVRYIKAPTQCCHLMGFWTQHSRGPARQGSLFSRRGSLGYRAFLGLLRRTGHTYKFLA